MTFYDRSRNGFTPQSVNVDKVQGQLIQLAVECGRIVSRITQPLSASPELFFDYDLGMKIQRDPSSYEIKENQQSVFFLQQYNT